MVARALLFGTGTRSRRSLSVVAGAFVAASLLVAVSPGPIRTAGRYPIWAGLVAAGLASAWDAGRHRGGLLAGWGGAFLGTLWGFVVPPLVALVRGDAVGDGGYAVPRPSAAALDPRAELLTGLGIGPVVALAVALTLGSAAFALGALLRRRSGASERT